MGNVMSLNVLTKKHSHVCVCERSLDTDRKEGQAEIGKLVSAATHFLEIFDLNTGSSVAAKDKRK